MKHVALLLVFFIVISFSGAAFYWFQWRPSEVRKQCNEDVRKRARGAKEKRDSVTSEAVNFWYGTCLVENGIASEPLLHSTK